MKRFACLAVLVCILVALSGCGPIQGKATLLYGESCTVTLPKTYEDLSWSSDNSEIVRVDGQVFTSVAPGTATVTATAGGKAVAVYTVTVNTVPVTELTLSETALSIMEWDSATLEHSYQPKDASLYGFAWTSSNPNVATVDENGTVTAVAPGEATVMLAAHSGVVAQCAVTVTVRPAYLRLTAQQKDFVDAFLGHAHKLAPGFTVEAVEAVSDTWLVRLAGDGGSTLYWISALTMLDVDEYMDCTHEDTFDLALINEAIADSLAQ